MMASGWHSCFRENLKRARGLERNLSSLSWLSSSAHTFFFPETCETSRATEWACDQEATRRRKRLSGQAVEKSLLTRACGHGKGKIFVSQATVRHLDRANCARVSVLTHVGHGPDLRNPAQSVLSAEPAPYPHRVSFCHCVGC